MMLISTKTNNSSPNNFNFDKLEDLQRKLKIILVFEKKFKL